MKHCYDQFIKPSNRQGELPASEHEHMQMLNHFTEKFTPEIYKMNPLDRKELKKKMMNYPNKNHEPIPPNR